MTHRRAWLAAQIRAGDVTAAAGVEEQLADQDFIDDVPPEEWCRRVVDLAEREVAGSGLRAGQANMFVPGRYLGRMITLLAGFVATRHVVPQLSTTHRAWSRAEKPGPQPPPPLV